MQSLQDYLYSQTTEQITVNVRPIYLEEQSSPEDRHYVWAYQVKIENHGPKPVKLINRFWKITDGIGRIHEVSGCGVVGEQPILNPGDSFEYTSGTPLETPSGFMNGTYEMETIDGNKFNVLIPTFSLDSPYENQKIH